MRKYNMKTKTKKIIILVLVIILVIIAILLGIKIFLDGRKENSKDKEDNKDNCTVLERLDLKVGDAVPSANSYLINCGSNGSIKYYLNDQEVTLNSLDTPNEYKVEIDVNGKKYTSLLIVKEKETIILEVKDLTISYGDKYTAEDFVKKCESSNGECKISFQDEKMSKYTDEGEYEVIIEATIEEEKVNKKAKLTIEKKEEDKGKEEAPSNPNNPSDNTGSSTNPPKDNGSSVTKVRTEEEKKETKSYKYGVTITTTTTIYYDVYSDGSRKEVDRRESTSYDYSTFNATTSDLLGEAQSLASSQYNTLASVVSYVNQYRSEANVPPITMDSALNVAAMVRALEIGWSRKFEHTRPNGDQCFEVVRELGIPYSAIGENIAYGYYDAASVSDGWRHSQGHYENMVSPNFTKIGVGYANVNGGNYWVQIFIG